MISILSLVFFSGCLIIRHTTNIVRKNEKPRAVQFESAQAKNVFDGKLADVKSRQSMSNPHVLAVPFLLLNSSAEVVSDNGMFNDQALLCDSNGDGIITLKEAQIYAARAEPNTVQEHDEVDELSYQLAKSIVDRHKALETKKADNLAGKVVDKTDAAGQTVVDEIHTTGKSAADKNITTNRAAVSKNLTTGQKVVGNNITSSHSNANAFKISNKLVAKNNFTSLQMAAEQADAPGKAVIGEASDSQASQVGYFQADIDSKTKNAEQPQDFEAPSPPKVLR
jgi:hypothetical protein